MPRIGKNVYEVKSKVVSMFVYATDQGLICFDSGLNEGAVRREFESLSLNPEFVTNVFLTHTDRDHVGGLDLFKNAKLYLSFEEEQMVDKRTPRFLGFVHNPPIEKPYRLLSDGDIVQAAETKIEAIATPGHTPGSMSYLVDESTLFTGDTVPLKEGKVLPFSKPRFFDFIRLRSLVASMDTTTQAESVRKLAKLQNVSLMATAHTGFTTNFAYAMSEWA
ncbi:MAG TPA: MBL fold metallo-hydrolase [Candidatus Acidoferrales bacterium]|nr:MBL fold metallo-hydrolase [Candidatus Acidoferrales bacterium]